MRIVNHNYAVTGYRGPYCIDLQEDFWGDFATESVIDATPWIATGSHTGSPIHERDGGGYRISAETLRSLWVEQYY
jgi:hypothetical protein